MTEKQELLYKELSAHGWEYSHEAEGVLILRKYDSKTMGHHSYLKYFCINADGSGEFLERKMKKDFEK